MEHKDMLLESIVELRNAHEKASKLMAEIATTAAKAVKGKNSLPSLDQLRSYEKAVEVAQQKAVQSQRILVEGVMPQAPNEGGSCSSYFH
jgi:hypothetical protein